MIPERGFKTPVAEEEEVEEDTVDLNDPDEPEDPEDPTDPPEEVPRPNFPPPRPFHG